MGQLTRTQVAARQRRLLMRFYDEFEPGVPKVASYRSVSNPRTYNAVIHDGQIFEQLGILVRETVGSRSTWCFPLPYNEAYQKLRTFQKEYADTISQIISERTKQVKPWTYVKRRRIVETQEEIILQEESEVPAEEEISSVNVTNDIEETVLIPLINALQTAITSLRAMKERDKV